MRGEAGRVERRAFLATLGALAVAGCGGSTGTTSTIVATTANGVRLPGAPDDNATLGYFLTLEQLQADLYNRAAQSGVFKGRELDTIRHFSDVENQHVADITATLQQRKVRPTPAPQTRFPLGNRETILDTALRLENLTAAAYLGQLGRLADRGLLATLLSVHTVEARHAATLNMMRGKPPTPTGAFARPENMAVVDNVLNPYRA